MSLWQKVSNLFTTAVDHVKQALAFLQPSVTALAHNLEALGVLEVEKLFAAAGTIVEPLFAKWAAGEITGAQAMADAVAQLKPVAVAAGLDAEHKMAGTILKSVLELKVQEQVAKALDAPTAVTAPSA